MIVARARYIGKKRGHTRRGPSETYRFPKRNVDDPWVDIEDPEDARYFERRNNNIEVEWTALGKIRSKFSGVEEVLSQGYQAKRSLAADLGLSFEEQPDEDTLDETLEDYIEDLNQQRR